jgi:hypothetical protein
MVLWKSWGERCALRRKIPGAAMAGRPHLVLELSKAILLSQPNRTEPNRPAPVPEPLR